MSLDCGYDESENFVEFSEELIVSPGTEFCAECGRLIPCGEEHYLVWTYRPPDWDCPYSMLDRTHLAVHSCCEECGDLALSWLELGYCWTYGDLRSDIQELNEFY